MLGFTGLKFLNIRQLFSKYKTPILYSGGSVFKAFAQMIVGFILARFISPNDLGIWSAISLVITYSIFLQAGLINGLNLELPHAYGRGDDEKAIKFAGTAQSFTIISSSLVFVIGILYFLLMPNHNPKIKYGLLAVTFIIPLSYYQNYLLSTFRSKNSFLRLSFIQIVEACVNISTLTLVAYFSYYGLIIKAVLVILVYVLLLHLSRPIKVGLRWNKEALIKLLKIGLPIFGLGYLESLASTSDKLWLLKYSDLNDVGLYSFGFYSLSTFSLLSLSLANYIYPKMSYNYGKNNDKAILWKYVKKITFLLLVIQIPIAILGYFILPILIQIYFPKYILSITVMQILVFAGVFKGSVIGVNALWSIKNWKYMIIYQVNFSFLLVILPYIGILLFKNKIEGVAIGILIAHFLNFITGISLTYFATKN